PPTAPAGLRYTAGPGQYAVRLSWEASTDNLGVARYDIYINERKVFSNPSPSFTVTGLDSMIPYRFTVRAAGSAGNISPPSNQVSYLPPGTAGGELPAKPAEFSAEAISDRVIALRWESGSEHLNGFELVRANSASGPFKPLYRAAKEERSFRDSGLSA